MGQFFSKVSDIQFASPILSVCARNCDMLDDDICSKLVQMPWSTPESVQVGVELLTVLLGTKRHALEQQKQDVEGRIVRMADHIYAHLPRTASADAKAKTMILD